LRDLITATIHGRDPDAHVEAMLAALAWYREEPVERTAVSVTATVAGVS
jgi:hypothetical protein